MQNFMLLSMQF